MSSGHGQTFWPALRRYGKRIETCSWPPSTTVEKRPALGRYGKRMKAEAEDGGAFHPRPALRRYGKRMKAG